MLQRDRGLLPQRVDEGGGVLRVRVPERGGVLRVRVPERGGVLPVRVAERYGVLRGDLEGRVCLLQGARGLLREGLRVFAESLAHPSCMLRMRGEAIERGVPKRG